MLELRLQKSFAFPAGRQARLNRAHPLFSQAHFLTAAVAQGKGMRDLVTGAYAGGSTTLSGADENGPYVWSNDGAGTATCSFATPTTTFEFGAWGCIFKLAPGAGRQYVFAYAGNSGVFINGATITFQITGGALANFNGIAGHTYFGLQNNATGTASKQRTSLLVDLTTGQVSPTLTASTGNVIVSPVAGLVTASTFVGNCRLYAMFASGSVLTPPAVNPAACFFSIDQFMSGVKDPWGLWYA